MLPAHALLLTEGMNNSGHTAVRFLTLEQGILGLLTLEFANCDMDWRRIYKTLQSVWISPVYK